MLAQNFLDAEALGISEVEHRAAVQLLGMLERGEITYATGPHPAMHERLGSRWLSMNRWPFPDVRDECGTIACIGGWMQVIRGAELSYETMRKFHDLFFPDRYDLKDLFTVELCAQALRAKLTTGKADWSGVAA